jgi:hypothetical protein
VLAACLVAGAACATNPVPLGNAPGAYDVQVIFTPRPNTSTVAVMLDLFYQGQGQSASGDQSVACDGVRLVTHPDSPTLYGTIPERAPGSGGAYRCVFTSQGQTATMLIPPLLPPAVTTPKAGATLARTARLTVAFAPGDTIAQVGVYARSSDLQYYDFTAQQTGPTTFVVEPQDHLRYFVPGRGSLDVTFIVITNVLPTGGVHSLTAFCTPTTTVPVVWS